MGQILDADGKPFDRTPNFIVVFECHIDGQPAQVEVPTFGDPARSRQTRKAAEIVARASFEQLSPKFNRYTKIKAVEVLPIV